MKNSIQAEQPREDDLGGQMKEIEGEGAVESDFADYLKDESRLSGGKARCIAFPRSEADISLFLKKMSRSGTPVTVSGGRTGITGGAVPFGGALLSMERMDRFLDIGTDEKTGDWYIRAQPGMLLKTFHRKIQEKDLKELLESPSEVTRNAARRFIDLQRPFFYPVDATEDSAALGGTISTNASGERSFRYGPTRGYVRAVRVVLASGDVLDVRRGAVEASSGDWFEIALTNGEKISIKLPSYRMPGVKNAAGYYVKDGMDLIDLFIGSEGTLGVISEAEFKIVERPENLLSLVAFFPSEKDAASFYISARAKLPGALVYEYFDSRALDLLRAKKERDGSGSGIAKFPDTARAGIFFELEFSEENLDDLYGGLEKLLQEHNSSTDDTWGGMEPEEMEKIRGFRHAIPEAVNEVVAVNKRNCPAVHKVGTDMAVPAGKLEEMINYYYARLGGSGLDFAVFGHIGENHLHVNILPKTEEELGRAKEICRDFARKAVSMGGTISAEHGIGKMKHDLLEILYGEEGMRQMAGVKKALDPRFILNRGNIIPESLLGNPRI